MTTEPSTARIVSIAAIPADGVGAEVVAAGRTVLDALAAHSGGRFAFIANPIGAIGSAALMLEHFGLTDEAARLQKAIEATTGAELLTRDVGGTAPTDEVVAAVVENLAL